MTYYLYFSHVGDFYTDTHVLSEEDTYCAECMDSGELIGTFKTKEELIQLLILNDAYDETISYVVEEWERDVKHGRNNRF